MGFIGRTFALTTGLALLPAAAWSQDGFDAHGLALVAQDGDVRDHLMLQRPGELSANSFFAAAMLEYAHRPLVRVQVFDDGTQNTVAALDQVIATHLSLGYTPVDELRIHVSTPIFLSSMAYGNPQGATLGDVRLDAMALLVNPADQNGIGLGVSPWLDIPLGQPTKFLGKGGFGAGATVASTLERDQLTLTGNLGAQLSSSSAQQASDPNGSNFAGGLQLLGGIGGNYLLNDTSSIGAEARFVAPLSSSNRTGAASPAEGALSYRMNTESGGYFTGGFAFPMSPAAGTAAFRVFISGGFGVRPSPSATPVVKDAAVKDESPDKTEAAPSEKVVQTDKKDKDGDGIPDKMDECKNEPETINGIDDLDGCPEDLPRLTMRVLRDGAPTSEATLTATSGDLTVNATAENDAYTITSPASASWDITAKLGTCLSGSATLRVGTADRSGDISLRIEDPAFVTLDVRDADGNPIPSAVITWSTEDMSCVPSDVALDFGGRASFEVGAGRHKMTVSAPGFRSTSVPLFAASGESLPYEVALVPED